ncbi:MAG: DUF711 family protein [Phycisphaerae bacterium]|nr:DUF711 family protein [Phycisphaerae bacterium]
MKIRSVTLGINWDQKRRKEITSDIEKFFTEANTIFTDSGFESRTQRIALPRFTVADKADAHKTLLSVEQVSTLCKDIGIRWFSVPFYAFRQKTGIINDIAVEIAEKHKNAFINYIVTENNQLDINAFYQASNFVHRVSQLSDNGFDNFRCGVSFNCKPNGAFFPFTDHSGNNGFSIALELIPLCVEVVRQNQERSLEEIRDNIIEKAAPILKNINNISERIEKATGIKYYGIDASLAPHPEHPEHSVAFLVELLGVERFGSSGTTFITSFLTNIIKSMITISKIKSTGFNGVMYSVLEDPRLGVVNNEPLALPIDSLLAFSTMCGCGIDMVPIPGDTSAAQMASIMLDIAAIATKLDKPLGVRLLPIPGKNAGQTTDFDHDFLHNTKIQQLKSHPCHDIFFNTQKSFSYTKP